MWLYEGQELTFVPAAAPLTQAGSAIKWFAKPEASLEEVYAAE